MNIVEKEKVVSLISGGIDSPLAALLFSESADIIPLHFSHYPLYCENSFNLAVEIIGKLHALTNFEKLIVFPFGEILGKVVRNKDFRKYTCVICRRCMFMVAEQLCEQEGAAGIVTGEVLGQKASQTLDNLNAIARGIRYPIYKPLLCMDKLEIITMAQEKGIWQEKHVGCCNVTPSYPTTAASAERIDEIIQDLNLKELINELFSKILILRDFKNQDLELTLLNYLYSLK